MVARGIVIVGFCLLFWFICYTQTGTDKKNMLGYRSYPDAVQELVLKNEELSKLAPKEISIPKIFLSNLVLFTVIFLITGIIMNYTVGFQDFKDCLIYFMILGEILNLFDLVVIDLLWWRNTKRIRFSFIQDKELYQDPAKHLGSFDRGVFMYIIVAFIVAGIITLLP